MEQPSCSPFQAMYMYTVHVNTVGYNKFVGDFELRFPSEKSGYGLKGRFGELYIKMQVHGTNV